MAGKREDEVSTFIAAINTLELQDVEVTRENILHPRTDFVITFYQAVFNFIKTKLSEIYHADEQTTSSEPNASAKQLGHDFGPEIYICAQMYKLLAKIGVDYFSINDVLSPKLSFTRTKVYFKCLQNFLIYMSHEGELASDIIEEFKSFQEENEALKKKKSELMEAVNAKSEACALKESKRDFLVKKLEMVNQEYAEMIKRKKVADEINEKGRIDLQKHTDILTRKTEYLEMLKSQERELQKKIVPVKENETVKQMIETLKIELAQLEKEEALYEAKYEEKKAQCKYLSELFEDIHGINYDLLNTINDIHDIQKQTKELQICCDGLSSEIRAAESAILNTKDKIHSIEESKQSHLITNKTVKDGLAKEIEEHEKVHAQDMKYFENITMRIQTVESEVNKCQEDYAKSQLNKERIMEAFQNSYKKMLNAENNVILKFNESLIDISDTLSKAE